MAEVKYNIKYMIFLLILLPALIHSQDSSSFYFNLNAIQEYHGNLYRLPDSLKKADYCLNSYVRSGWRKKWAEDQKFINIYYENRIRRYYKYQTYSRMEHILFSHGYRQLTNLGKLIINEQLRIRDYNSDNSINSLRSIFSIYLQTSFFDGLQLNSGYRHWLKRYPLNTDYQDYSSQRLFFNFYYSLSRKKKIGLQNELNWHNGNLYPYGAPKTPGSNLHGFRYTAEFSGNQIFAGEYFFDLRYRFEWDSPKDIDQEDTGDYSGDDNTEELLAEDSDFDYVKHQLSGSILYKATSNLSFFNFVVVQGKQFQHWQITENGPLRRDVFRYLSLTVKYKFHKNLFAELYLNLEKNYSNHPDYNYLRQIIGLGIRYSF